MYIYIYIERERYTYTGRERERERLCSAGDFEIRDRGREGRAAESQAASCRWPPDQTPRARSGGP